MNVFETTFEKFKYNNYTNNMYMYTVYYEWAINRPLK